ncbi:hypothetical protein LTS10_001530 [Elasticomyces elasticus]|nr:hypothetical protein LTS10_001530 [Elasticomyces elasticus]
MAFLTLIVLPALASAHIAAFGPGMYCRDGLPGQQNKNNNLPVAPLYQHTKEDWWFQHDRGCDTSPPPAGEFLELPVGGNFTVEHANNQAFTTLSYDGKQVTDWPDGGNHPDDWHGEWKDNECITEGGWMHATNQINVQGSAFAIAYKSNFADITMEDLVVFTVLEQTISFSINGEQVGQLGALVVLLTGTFADLNDLQHALEATSDLRSSDRHACVSRRRLYLCASLGAEGLRAAQYVSTIAHTSHGGVLTAPRYMQGFKCKTTGEVGTKQIAKAQPPVWCADDASKCKTGAKQMIVFNQLEGNNVPTPDGETPAYNVVAGFKPGAQDDIFVAGSPPTSTSKVASTSKATPAPASSLSSRTVSSARSTTRPHTTSASPATTPLPHSTPACVCSDKTVTVTVTAA